jgi:hypothetical protein
LNHLALLLVDVDARSLQSFLDSKTPTYGISFSGISETFDNVGSINIEIKARFPYITVKELVKYFAIFKHIRSKYTLTSEACLFKYFYRSWVSGIWLSMNPMQL